MMYQIRSLAFVAAIAGIAAAGAASAIADPSIAIVASNWKFTPSEIQLHVGETTTLRLTSTQGVHGLESSDLGIPQTTIVPGTTKAVEVTPKKPGKYVLHCAIMCGAGHPNMTLTVNVVQ
jgi:cytochrome c oxidase subunit II